ncbi:MAG: protoglobin family protein [Isosphaeraceae bacterium]
MKLVDERRLETDLRYRFGYLAEFIGFGAEEVAALSAAAPSLTPMFPALVDAVYDQLHAYDATWRHLAPTPPDFGGAVATSVSDVPMDHPSIRYRKEHLTHYLCALVSWNSDASGASYLDMLGRLHCGSAGAGNLDVPLVQMNAMLGFLSDALAASVLGLDVDCREKVDTFRALNKLLWIQNDLINRHDLNVARGKPEVKV